MSSGALLFSTMPLTYNPALLSLSGWWRASYSGLPWAATASAGASGTTGSLVTNLSDPATGAAQNGLTPADFDGTANNAINATASTTLFSASAGTIVALFRADTAAAPTGSTYNDPALYVDAGVANTGLTYTTSGFTGFVVVSAAYKSVSVAAATGAYHLVMMRWNGSVLGVRVDSGAESTVAAAAVTLSAGTVAVGRGYAGTFVDGRLLELMTSASDLSASYSNIKSYINSRYALSL